MNVVIFGAPLSGKGTHTKFLHKELGFDVVSTGDLLRQEIELGTNLGKSIEPLLKAGNLIGVDDVLKIVEGAYAQRQSEIGVVFDGSPRRMEEFHKLRKMLRKSGEKIDQIIVLDVPEPELYTRMEGRRANMIARGERPRDDDQTDVLRERLLKYKTESVPIIAEARNYNIDVRVIDANRPLEAQREDLLNCIETQIDNPMLYYFFPGFY